MEMQTRGGLVEDEERRLLLLLTDEIGQFDALVLTTGERAGVLSQFDIAQTNILQGLQTVDDGLLSVGLEELDGLGDGHIQDIVDILALVFHVQDIVLETLAVTGFALQHEVGHELHLDGDSAGTLTLVAASAIGIE